MIDFGSGVHTLRNTGVGVKSTEIHTVSPCAYVCFLSKGLDSVSLLFLFLLFIVLAGGGVYFYFYLQYVKTPRAC